MILTTTPSIEGKKITEYLGVVTALAELEEVAKQKGADAVVGIDLDFEVVGAQGSMLMVNVSGTAVKLG